MLMKVGTILFEHTLILMLKGYDITLTVSRDNKYIISGSRDKTLKVFDIEKKTEVFRIEEAHQGNTIFSLAYLI